MRARQIAVAAAFLALLRPGVASAHCDALDGPVVKAARLALDTRSVAPVLAWVAPEHEAEVRDAFDRAVRVRAAGGDAQDLADTWFFETLVRLHRAGEGAPFEGLKPAGSIPPVVAAVDETLETGEVEKLVEDVTGEASRGVRERFARAHAARAQAGESVEAGRRFVAAYVAYVHHVESLHRAATGGDAEHATKTAPAASHAHSH